MTLTLPERVRGERAAYFAIAFSSILWGFSFLFGKMALAELAASQVIVGRFLISALILLPQAVRLLRGLPKGDLPHFILSGVLMIPVMMWVQFEGLSRTTATSSALIIATIPALMAVAAVIFDKERLGPKGWTAVALSTAGAVFLVGTPGAGRSVTGDLLVLLSTVAAVAWVLVTRRLLKRYPSVQVTATVILFGTLAMLPLMLWQDGLPDLQLRPATWGALAVLGVGCSALTYVLWNWGLQKVPASRAGVFVNLEPLVGAVLGVAVLGDTPGMGTLFGGVLIITAALLSSGEAAETEAASQGAMPVVGVE